MNAFIATLIRITGLGELIKQRILHWIYVSPEALKIMTAIMTTCQLPLQVQK